MPSLLPAGTVLESNIKQQASYEFKSTYAYDFVNKKFIKNTDGTIKKLTVFDSYVVWCHKALLTTRYMYCIYDYYYGADKIDIVNLDETAIELEIKRTVKECLMVHPLTKSVDNFTFIWTDTRIDYTFELTSTLSSKTLMSSSIELRWNLGN